MHRLHPTRLLCLLLGGILAVTPVQAYAFSRVKDLVDVEGVRDNMLVGYGLVVGLNGTGNSLKNAPFTQQSIQTMLERLGVNTVGQTMQTKDVAAVMVTANLPAFAAPGHAPRRLGQRARRRQEPGRRHAGGDTALGADSQIYAVGQGPSPSAVSRAGRRFERHQGRADRRAHRQRRDRRARNRLLARQAKRSAAVAAQSGSDDRLAHRRLRSIPISARASPRRPILPPSIRRARQLSERHGRPSHRHRAGEGRSRPSRQGHHRRTIRRDRDGLRRAHIHSRHRPGQSHHPESTRRRRSVSQRLSRRRTTTRSFRARRSRSTTARATRWRSSTTASACRASSTA